MKLVFSALTVLLYLAAAPYATAQQKIPTGLGEIETDPIGLVIWFLNFSSQIGGGIAFLLLLYGAFTLMTSAGNPEKVNQGKEIITSALSGLLLIIFAIFLLRFIAVDLLKLPDFQK